MMKWSRVSKINSNKTIAVLSIWIFATPLIIKSVELIGTNSTITLTHLTSDSSIIILYFSAVSFFLGGIIYNINAPEIIKAPKIDLKESSPSETELVFKRYLSDATKRTNTEINKELLKIEKPTPDDIDAKNTILIELYDVEKSYNIKTEDSHLVHEIIFSVQDSQSRISIILSLAFQITGFSLLLYLGIRNMASVLLFMIEQH